MGDGQAAGLPGRGEGKGWEMEGQLISQAKGGKARAGRWAGSDLPGRGEGQVSETGRATDLRGWNEGQVGGWGVG